MRRRTPAAGSGWDDGASALGDGGPEFALGCGAHRVMVHWHTVARLPRGVAAVTLGQHVFVRHGVIVNDFLRDHEHAHVAQWREQGALRFVLRYVGQYLLWRLRRKGHLGAYWRIDAEIDADWQARRAVVDDRR